MKTIQKQQNLQLNISGARKRPLILLFSFLFFMLPGISQATKGLADLETKEITEVEMRLLPRYCADTQSFPRNYQARRGYWVGVMGPDFQHMHHYCRGLNKANRAQKANIPKQYRSYLWDQVVDEYKYMINNATPDFVLLPEIYTRKGEAELRRGNPDAANNAFNRARTLKPDYWPAYSRWADYLMTRGQRAEALKIVRSGLEHSPDARPLLELYRLLGGTPSSLPPTPTDSNQPNLSPSQRDAPAPAKTRSGTADSTNGDR